MRCAEVGSPMIQRSPQPVTSPKRNATQKVEQRLTYLEREEEVEEVILAALWEKLYL
jgi:hypothetical protein